MYVARGLRVRLGWLNGNDSVSTTPFCFIKSDVCGLKNSIGGVPRRGALSNAKACCNTTGVRDLECVDGDSRILVVLKPERFSLYNPVGNYVESPASATGPDGTVGNKASSCSSSYVDRIRTLFRTISDRDRLKSLNASWK